MLIVYTVRKFLKVQRSEAKLAKAELPFVVLMVLLDIAAPAALMMGLTITTSSTAALLNNFEIVATSVIALVVFKEAIGKRLWLSITFITIFSIILSVKDFSDFSLSIGAARTSVYYAIAPFIGVGISLIVFSVIITISFIIASAVMILGTYLAVAEKHVHEHIHMHIEHEHRHNHSDEHYNHSHLFLLRVNTHILIFMMK